MPQLKGFWVLVKSRLEYDIHILVAFSTPILKDLNICRFIMDLLAVFNNLCFVLHILLMELLTEAYNT